MKHLTLFIGLSLCFSTNAALALDKACQPLVDSMEKLINTSYQTETTDSMGSYQNIFIGDKKYADDGEGNWELLGVNPNEEKQKIISDIKKGTELKIESCKLEGSKKINGKEVDVFKYKLSFVMMGSTLSNNMERHIGKDGRTYLEIGETMGNKKQTTYTYEDIKAPKVTE